MSKTFPQPTVSEWFAGSPVQAVQNSSRLNWNAVSMYTARLSPPKEYYISPQTSDITLVTILAGATRWDAYGRTSTRKYIRELMTPGSVNLLPPHHEFEARWEQEVSSGFVMFPPDVVTELLETSMRGDPLLHTLPLLPNIHDPLLNQLTLALTTELYNGSLHTPLYADSIARTMILHLFHQYSNVTFTKINEVGKLTYAQRADLEAYIDSMLDQKITLTKLARLFHVSTSHFARLFHATYAMPPYQFVIHKRVERAKGLLCDRQNSLYDVARECGFANQSHFTRHFTNIVGVTPGHYAHHVQ